jgi:hypothetical protein
MEAEEERSCGTRTGGLGQGQGTRLGVGGLARSRGIRPRLRGPGQGDESRDRGKRLG